ncbi:MAG TPA: hypothetical protein VK968_11200, partial [Roseimicrobium sp.]|nr:hypothetical protein [Roseimicrobium sp.]
VGRGDGKRRFLWPTAFPRASAKETQVNIVFIARRRGEMHAHAHGCGTDRHSQLSVQNAQVYADADSRSNWWFFALSRSGGWVEFTRQRGARRLLS